MAGNIYHSWNGTVLTITSDSGTSSANLKGDDGARGAQGVAGGTCYNVCVAPRNILDNSYFPSAYLINQRGITSQVGGGYGVDRWRADGSGTITVAANGITLKDEISLRQPVQLKAGTYTLAFKLTNGKLLIISFQFDGAETHKTIYSDATMAGAYVNYYKHEKGVVTCQFVLSNGYEYTLEWAALYEGEYTADTLPAYQYKGYAAELLECQRYYIKIATQPINGWCYNWGRVAAFVSLPVKMRVPYPTVVLAQETPNFYVNATAYNAALEGSTSVENGVVIYYTHTAAINGQCVIPEFAAEINADL